MFRTIFAKWRALPFSQRAVTTILPFAMYGAYIYKHQYQNKSALIHDIEADIAQEKIRRQQQIVNMREILQLAEQQKQKKSKQENTTSQEIKNTKEPEQKSEEKQTINSQISPQEQKKQAKQQQMIGAIQQQQQQMKQQKQQVKQEVKQAKQLVKQEVKQQAKQHVKQEVKQEVKQQIKQEVKQQAKQEVKQEVKQQVKQQLQTTQEQQQPAQKQQQKKPQKIFFQYKSLKQIPQVPSSVSLQQLQKQNIILISDIGYTSNFEQQLIKYLTKINKFLGGDVKIYVVSDLESNPQLRKRLQLQLKDQTIFFIKNKYHNQFVNIDFMTYMKFATAPFKYLQAVNCFTGTDSPFKQKFIKMSPYEAYLILVSDIENETQQQKKKKLRAAKQAEMQLSMNNTQNVKVFIMDKKQLVANKILKEENAKPNTLHLVRKANQFTRTSPNVYLQSANKQHVPFHIIEGISFMNKKGQMLIGRYLDLVETFSSQNLYYPYTCLITINRNKIPAQQYYKLMRTFAKLKNQQVFPNISFMLKFDNIPYKGQKNQLGDNQEWALKVVHVNELEKQSYLHEISKREQLIDLQIKEEDWLRNSYEYLYQSDSTEEQDIRKFITNALEGKVQQFYKSQKPSQLMNMHQVTANTLKSSILQNNQDHVLFQYSEFCPTCKVISPLLSYMNEIYKGMRLKNPDKKYPLFHRVNCDRNRIKQHLYTPYLPNIYYFKNEWKKYGPVRLPIQTIKQAGAMSIHQFCLITSKVGTVPWQLIEKAVQNAQKVKLQKI